MLQFATLKTRKSTTTYNPFMDKVRTPRQKMEMVFTPRQMELAARKDVTKSLILACTKIVKFKQTIDEVVSKWVGQDTSKFIRTLPIITYK